MKTTSTSTSKKVTKKDCFLALHEILTDGTSNLETEILRDFVNHEMELLERKNSKTKKKDVEETKALHNKILEVLEGEEKMTSLEVFIAIVPSEKAITPQKVTYELNALVKQGKVVKEVKSKEKKGKTAFSLS